MQVSEVKLSLCTTGTAAVLGFIFIYARTEMVYGNSLIFFAFLGVLLHLLPLFIPFFFSVTSKMKRWIKSAIGGLSGANSVVLAVLFWKDTVQKIVYSLLVGAYLLLSLSETALIFTKMYLRYRRKKSLRSAPVIKRKFGNEIKLPIITMSTEVKHLRTKTDFIINGTVYIRKGETVELLKTIGSYYSVRNSTGTEYIVPKTNFF